MEEKKILLQEWLIIFIVLSSIFALVAITHIKREKLKTQISLNSAIYTVESK